MAQAHKAQKQPQDPYAQQGKKLASSVQRLRGWVGSDPSRAPELADALIELTAHRLLGHGYAAAAEDAQDSVRRAAELLAAQGPIGPYTSVSDAARYVTAVVHLATIQVGMSMPDAAGHTMELLQDIREQLREHRLEVPLQPQTTIWALSCSSRSALASGDIAGANSYADAAVVRWAESDLGKDPDAAYLAVDINRLASDCRWAAGRAQEALSYLHVAKDHYDDVVAGRLDEPGRLSPALLERLAEPLFSLYRDMADRLVAIDEVDLGLTTRRRLIELLRGLSERLGDPVRDQLATALTDLARDLAKLDRLSEADALSAEAAVIMPPESADVQDRDVVKLGTEMIAWYPLPSTASYAATTASSADMKFVDLAALQRAWRQRATAWLEAERPQAQRLELERMEQARAEAERREAERVQAERAEAEKRAGERARAVEAQRLEAERRAAAEEAERQERKRRRQERIEAHRLEVERREAERREAERLKAEQRAAEELAADPAEAERLELERLQAEIDELERAERMARGEEPPPTAG
jgi:hypothetical protein